MHGPLHLVEFGVSFKAIIVISIKSLGLSSVS